MQIQIFTISIFDKGESIAEMNRFLANSRVLEVEQKFFQNEKGGFWSFCVRYISGSMPSQKSNFSSKEKVDYKQLLTESEFGIFTKLRECRKILATNEALPAYAIFTDEELAGITKLSNIVTAKLVEVKGIGEKKIEKYGNKLIELLKEKTEADEKGR